MNRVCRTLIAAPLTALLVVSGLLWIPESADAKDKITVVTTFTILKDMAENVAGDAATVVSVTKPNAEIHNYQPTPKDMGRTRKADLVLWNGLNLELWLSLIHI